MGVTLAELARLVQGTVRGESGFVVERANSLECAGPQDISFATGARYLDRLADTHAGVVILTELDAARFSRHVLMVNNPALAFARVCAHLHPPLTPVAGVHSSAVVDPSARIAATATIAPTAVVGPGTAIGERVSIGPGCVVGRNCVIGEHTRLIARVVVQDDCVIGRNGLLHAGAVIGSDGFGFARDGSRWIKQPQLGRVVVGNDVEVGANTTIDRGTMGDTLIGDGVKLDNLVHIAHNVRIGDDTAIAAGVGIAGSTVIGKRCTIAGQAGIIEHLQIVDDVHITATSLVTNSITQSGVYSSNLKAEPVAQWRRNVARLNQLDKLTRRLRQMEQQLQRLTKE